MDMNLSKLQKIVKDRGAWDAAIHGVAKSRHNLATNNNNQGNHRDTYQRDVMGESLHQL